MRIGIDKVAVLDECIMLDHLEALAHSLGLEVRYERMEAEAGLSSGGLCKVKGKQLIIINTAAPLKEKIQILARSVKRFDLKDVFLKPALREFLERPEEKS